MKHQYNIKKRTYSTLVKILHHIFITLISKSNHFMPHITDSLYSWCWIGPLEAICSKPYAQAKPLKAICPAPCPGRFWRAPRRNTPQSLWQPVPVFGHPHSEKAYLDVQRKLLCLFVPSVCILLLPVHSFPLKNTILVFDENLFTSAPAKLEDHLWDICTVSCLVSSFPFFPLYKFVSE